MSTIKINTCDREWFGKDYVFYDKQGNPINIIYDTNLDMYKGTQYFEENSSDTFKEIELNIFERIKGFEYKQYNVGTSSTYSELMTQKFQIFNTEGIRFSTNDKEVSIYKIESINNDPLYFSKWIYGKDIDILFPNGTEIKFNRDIFSINSNETYTVINSKQDAVLIITTQDNKTFTQTSGGSINNESNYTSLKANGVNVIKLYNYIDSDYKNNFPLWSEPNFYTQVYDGQRINIVNSNLNDSVVTVKNKSLGDNYYNIFKVKTSDVLGDVSLIIKNKTFNFNIFTGFIEIDENLNVIKLDSVIPNLLKPNTIFNIPSSTKNNINLTFKEIDEFSPQFYKEYKSGSLTEIPSQVSFNGHIYECILDYSPEFSEKENNVLIDPTNSIYWKRSNIIPIKENLESENIYNSDIFINDEIILNYQYDNNFDSIKNLSMCFDSFESDVNSIGANLSIDKYGRYGIIESNYPTDYLDIKFIVNVKDSFTGSSTGNTNFENTGYKLSKNIFGSNIDVKFNNTTVSVSEDFNSTESFGYFSNIGEPSQSTKFKNLTENSYLYWKRLNANFKISDTDLIDISYQSNITEYSKIIERVIETDETLSNEINNDTSEKSERRILFTDVDEYGINIKINEQEYYINTTFLYNDNGLIDMEETIDRTIKSWINKWKSITDSKGIEIFSDGYNNSGPSLHNSILIKGYYPNVNINIETVVGDTADFTYIDKMVILYESGDQFSSIDININNISYREDFSNSITNTLSNWINTYKLKLELLGIYTSSINNSLLFEKKSDILIDININTGKIFSKWERVYEIINYWKGNQGLILSGNSIIQKNREISFEEECFSTGHIISLNNSIWDLNNQEYNIVLVDPNRMTLSYQGPFWGTIDNNIQSAFQGLSFGDSLEVGDSLLTIINSNLTIGTVTSVSSNEYQIVYDINKTISIERKNAWFYDENADNISIDSLTYSIEYLPFDDSFTNIIHYKDIDKISLTNDTKVTFLDGNNLEIISDILIDEVTLKELYNPINKSIYKITTSKLIVIDPITEKLIFTYDFSGQFSKLPFDLCIDYISGDVYISFSDTDRIWKMNNDFTNISSSDYLSGFKYGRMTYNRDDKKVYVFTRKNININITSDKSIYRIDTNTNLRDISFIISGSTAVNIGNTDSYGGEIFYNEFNGDLYISNDQSLHSINTSNNTLVDLFISTSLEYSISFDSISKYCWISCSDNRLYFIKEDASIDSNDIGTYGNILFNDIDSNVYISSLDNTNKVYVYSTQINKIFYSFGIEFEPTKMILNKSSNSLIGVSENEDRIFTLYIGFIYNQLKPFLKIFNLDQNFDDRVTSKLKSDQENEFGIFSDNNIEFPYLYITTRDFIRKPRKNYMNETSQKVNWRFKLHNNDDDIFIYDISGDNLITTGSYSYTGILPLENPTLNKYPNSNLDKVGMSEYQQTVFQEVSYKLEYNDSNEDISFLPSGIQTFIGFSSKDEGVSENILSIYESEESNVSIPLYNNAINTNFNTTLPPQSIKMIHNEESGYAELELSDNSTDTFNNIVNLNDLSFSPINIREGNIIKISLKTSSNDPSLNDNMMLKVYKKFERKIIFEYVDTNRILINEDTSLNDSISYINIENIEKEILRIELYGQTEIEDIRYKTELVNVGKNINPEDSFIFKEYDINEGGNDWTYINQKRKEMLMVRNDIFNYIGSYKSLINAINYFGYNDLELHEYFKNINNENINFEKLSKIEIPDIFDNTIKGWSENYKKYRYPNKNFESTNLFNLTYRFTDFDGNHKETYSLQEAIIKLSGLKKWLEKNIVPITHKILDITGRVDFRKDLQIYTTPSSVTNFITNDRLNPINFDLNETYVLPIKSGSVVYNNVVDFYYDEFSEISKVDYFEINIKTYKIYDEWDVFKSYKIGDKVIYYGKIYENVLTDNTFTSIVTTNVNNNPLSENGGIDQWDLNITYNEGDIIKYKRDIYKYTNKTESVNYLPWIDWNGDCIGGTPSTTNGISDNFYNDLLDLISNEGNAPIYFKIDLSMSSIMFDILDIIKNQYNSSWCDLLTKEELLINQISVSMINTPESAYLGGKPITLIEARENIILMIDIYNEVKNQYKYKFIELTPEENVLLDNIDFILWEKITKWKEVDLDPVQSISEYRSGNGMLLPYNFTIDTEIDPYVIIKCTSDNGYGQIKTIEKSYEIKFDADSNSIIGK